MVFVFGVAQTSNGTLIILFAAILALAVIVLALVQTALQGAYSAALYRYSVDGNVGTAFSGTLLGGAFRPKR